MFTSNNFGKSKLRMVLCVCVCASACVTLDAEDEAHANHVDKHHSLQCGLNTTPAFRPSAVCLSSSKIICTA